MGFRFPGKINFYMLAHCKQADSGVLTRSHSDNQLLLLLLIVIRLMSYDTNSGGIFFFFLEQGLTVYSLNLL